MTSPRTLRFTIPGRLPGLNEMTLANRGNRYGGAKQKRDAQAVITPYVPRPIMTLRSPVAVMIHWHEPNARRDPDNVSAGGKFVLDALVTLGVLRGDGRKHIASIEHRVTTDKANPRIDVTVEEVEPTRADSEAAVPA